MVTLNASILTAPGTYVSEDTAGLIPAGLASFNRAYLVGTSSAGTRSEPTQVISVEDFVTKFGNSPSLDAVRLFFRNAPNSILYFVRAGDDAAINEKSWTITAAEPGTYTLFINGLKTTVVNNGTTVTITANTGVTAAVSGEVITLSTTTLSAIVLNTVDRGLVVSPVDQDDLYDQLIYTLENAFESDRDKQGFLLCPEGFQYLVSQADRTGLAAVMELICASEGFDWKAIIDSGGVTASLAQAQVERALYSSARGHSSYFFPYILSLENSTVPSSVAVTAIALLRYRSQGFNQPPAGAQFPIKGIIGVTAKVTKTQQGTVNDLGINCVRFFPNEGVLVYGSRTLSTNPYYRFINTRVILNVLVGTLRTAMNSVIFSAVDGKGILFSRIRETVEAICYSLWDGNALYGATPEEAFAVICNSQNNPAIDLENGIVRCDVYVATVPTLEKLLIGVTRTAIGEVQTTVAAITGA